MPEATLYRVGDFIRCVENDSFRTTLTLGEVFVVHRLSLVFEEQRVMVRRLSGEVLSTYSFRTRRFVRVPSCPSLLRKLGVPSA